MKTGELVLLALDIMNECVPSESFRFDCARAYNSRHHLACVQFQVIIMAVSRRGFALSEVSAECESLQLP